MLHTADQKLEKRYQITQKKGQTGYMYICYQKYPVCQIKHQVYPTLLVIRLLQCIIMYMFLKTFVYHSKEKTLVERNFTSPLPVEIGLFSYIQQPRNVAHVPYLKSI